MNSEQPKVVDLFAGVGGLSLGAARAGFTIALAVERDRHASAAHKINFPHTPHLETDIAKLSPDELLTAAGIKHGQLSGLIGGPPCQGFSTMGHRHSSDARNNLFRRFFELVAGCEPLFFLAENVPGICNDKFSSIRKDAFSLVRASYVLLEPLRLNASHFGAPTTRERIFFIGYKKNLRWVLTENHIRQLQRPSPITVSKALRGLPKRILSSWQHESQGWRITEPLPQSHFYNRVSGCVPPLTGDQNAIDQLRHNQLVSGCLGTHHTDDVKARFTKLSPGQMDQPSRAMRLEPHGLCPTLRAGTGSDRGSFQAVRPIHPTSPRVITPREAARLQGFPDWFQFAPSKWHSFRQIGNSVSPLLAEVLLKAIYNVLAPDDPPK